MVSRRRVIFRCAPSSGVARFSNDNDNRTNSASKWRQRQLTRLEQKFTAVEVVENEQDLQQMWRNMEGRVTRRRPRTVEETGGLTGRQNIKRTDEEFWLREGLYEGTNDDENSFKGEK